MTKISNIRMSKITAKYLKVNFNKNTDELNYVITDFTNPKTSNNGILK